MDNRTKDFNKYLDNVKIVNALTGCFARLFMFTDFDRPDHGIWFLQNCVDATVDPNFIVNYDKLANELAANTKYIKKAKEEEAKAKKEQEVAEAKAKKEQEVAEAKAKKEKDAAAAKAKKEAEDKQNAGVSPGVNIAATPSAIAVNPTN